MSGQESELHSTDAAAPDSLRSDDRGSSGRVSFERLRERTDELELLVSGLSMVALFSLPDWLITQWEASYAHLPLWALAGGLTALPMVIAVAYLLAGCFMVHLGIRAYWVGLVGLRSAYPQGIRWDSAKGMGPINRARLQHLLPSIETAIERADRLCSVLFSVITLAALTFLWLGFLLTLVFAGAGVVGNHFGSTNRTIDRAASVFLLVLIGSPILLWLLDALLAARIPRLAEWKVYRLLVRALAWLVGKLFPERLISPVRLTLQTNTRPRIVLALFVASIVVVPLLGFSIFQGKTSFDSFGTQRYLRNRHSADGLRSMHYESTRVGRDLRSAVPMIPSPVIEHGWTTLFLPYMPIRDDLLIEQRCGSYVDLTAKEDAELNPLAPADLTFEREAAWAASARECFSKLWEVRLNGKVVSLEQSWPSERWDLGFRGLEVAIDLRAEVPGPQRLEVIWRPHPEQDVKKDDYMPDIWRSVIPFIWSPEWAAEPGADARAPAPREAN